jgi:hypothetical protein
MIREEPRNWGVNSEDTTWLAIRSQDDDLYNHLPQIMRNEEPDTTARRAYIGDYLDSDNPNVTLSPALPSLSVASYCPALC